MRLKARIEKLETGRFNEADTVTLGALVAASYLEEGDPRLVEFDERCSRSRLGRMLAEQSCRGSRSDALIGGHAGETDQNVGRESGGGHHV